MIDDSDAVGESHAQREESDRVCEGAVNPHYVMHETFRDGGVRVSNRSSAEERVSHQRSFTMNSGQPLRPKDLDRLAIDPKKGFYWDGKLMLSPAQTGLAVAVAIAAICSSIGTVANATVNWLTYLERHKTPPVTQPTPAPLQTPTPSIAPSQRAPAKGPKG